MSQVVIVGGGIIGLLSAYELRKRGRRVIIIDRGEPGQGASAGNAGWITPSLSGPVPAPGVISESLRWMLRPDSPLYVSPAAVLPMARWLFSFWRHSNRRHYARGLAALAEFNRTTMADFDALQQQAGIQFEMHATGLLFVCMENKTVTRLLRDFQELEAYGFGTPVQYDTDEVRSIVPALKETVVGGVWMPHERHIRPESLMRAAVQWLKQHDVELMTRTSVLGLHVAGNRIKGVLTDKGAVPAEQILLATGAEAGALARQAGFRLPMQAGKGYSITIEQPALRVDRSLYLAEGRVAVTPFDNALRIAGTMELSGLNNRLDSRRLAGIRAGASRYLNDWERGGPVSEWVGMRPMLPDGLPAIGRLPGHDNVFIASGHAMLGITLGPTTAVAVARLMNEEPSDISLDAFDPARFHKKRTRVAASPPNDRVRHRSM